MGLLDKLGLQPLQRTRSGSLAGRPAVAPDADAFADDAAAPPPLTRRHTVGGGTPQPAPGGVSPQRSVYDGERAAVDKLVAALRGHTQAKDIEPQLDAIDVKLDAAADHADKAAWPHAMRLLKEVRADLATARQLAESWATFRKKRASVMALRESLLGLDDAAAVKVKNQVDAADAKVAPTPPDFVAATAALTAGDTAARPTVRGWLDDTTKLVTEITALPAAAQAFIAVPLAEGKALLAQAEAAFKAERWSEALIARARAKRLLAPSRGHALRRNGYDQKRALAVAAVAAVKALPAVADKGPWLDSIVARADGLASRDQLKIEEGSKLLDAVRDRCQAFQDAAPAAAGYNTERALADQEIAALDTHAAAAQVAEQRQAIRALLLEAGKARSDARANHSAPAPLWQTALTTVQRARADLAAAKQIAASMGPAAAAQAAAAGGAAADPKALKTALAALKADLAKAAGAAHAEAAGKALKRCRQQADDAQKALDKDHVKPAAKHLAEAAEALAEARTIEVEHGQYAAGLGAVQQRLAALQALPTAKVNKERVEAVAKALKATQKDDRHHEGSDAMADLRAAADAATAAELAHRERVEYDRLAKAVRDRIAGEITDKKLAKALEKTLDAADEIAAGFEFAAAQLALRKIGVTLDGQKLQRGMQAKPPDKKLLKDTANAMVRAGGADQVDTLIQGSPETSPDVILALASGRFDMEFKFKNRPPATPGGKPQPPRKEEVQSMKAICAMFAKIPDDLRDNPSIRGVTHADAVGSRGGDYGSQTRHIGMKGRLGGKQKFGANLKSKDKKTGKFVAQLPKDVDPDCVPKNPDEEVEYLGFAAAHEVGHGVDDLRGFMLKNGHQAKYGGWKYYGDSLQPIADAVGAHIAAKYPASKFYGSPESKQYVLDKLMSKPAERPAAAKDSPDDKALAAFEDWHGLATSENIYRRQGDCERIKIGTLVYHEAYKRQWVSYLADARKKGLTGYQFRAPGEWFAELYAGWKSGKLGPKHPALDWLTKL